MRTLRLAALLAALSAAACRRDPPPRPRPTLPAQPAQPAVVDAGAPRALRGLSATLLASSAARRSDAGGWVLTLRLRVHNQAAEALPLRREAIRVSCDDNVPASLDAPGAIVGPTTIAPNAREDVTVHAVFPPSATAPITVTFAFDSIGGLNHPISFPIPSA
jgi:hypothetical protein